jgi:dihydrofolate reductase
MRKIIAAIQTSLDGFVEGPNGEVDWIEDWEDPFDLLNRVDTFILGGGMYPGYAQYWRAILADPSGVLPFTGKKASAGEIEYARVADRTPHVVLSTSLVKADWHNTQIVRDLQSIRHLKGLAGKDMHAVGGASLIGHLLDAGLVDELQIIVHPILLGAGKALFKDVKRRHALRTVGAAAIDGGKIDMRFVL